MINLNIFFPEGGKGMHLMSKVSSIIEAMMTGCEWMEIKMNGISCFTGHKKNLFKELLNKA